MLRRIRNRFLLVVSGAVISCSGGSSAPSDVPADGTLGNPAYETAKATMLAGVVKPDTVEGRVAVFGLKKPLAKGTRVESFPSGGAADEVMEDAYFFWVDDHAGSLFAHATRYVFVGVADGKVTVLEHAMWPVIDGKAVFGEGKRDSLPEGADLVFESRALTNGRGRTASGIGVAASGLADFNDCEEGTPPPNFYSVLVAGGGSGAAYMTEDIDDMAKAVTRFGYPSAGDTVGNASLKIDAGNDPQAFAKFHAQLNWLASTARCCDRVLIYVISHGTRMVRVKFPDGREVWCNLTNQDETGKTDTKTITDFCVDDNGVSVAWPKTGTPGASVDLKHWGLVIGDRLLWDDLGLMSLAAWLKAIPSCHVTVIIDACFSGGMSDPLLGVEGVQNVITSTGDNETREYDAGWTDHGTNFSQGLVKGMNAVDPALSGPDLAFNDADQDRKDNGYDSFTKTGKDHPSVKVNTKECNCPKKAKQKKCGDGTTDPWEDCDPPTSPHPCPTGDKYCGPACIWQLDTTWCGDGCRDPSEQCEKDADCPPETTCAQCRCVSKCGNGKTDPGEDCDPPATLHPCPTGVKYCGPQCRYQVDTMSCGDGCLDKPTEQCEKDSDCAPDRKCCPETCTCQPK